MVTTSWGVRESVKSLEPISDTLGMEREYCVHVRASESLIYSLTSPL